MCMICDIDEFMPKLNNMDVDDNDVIFDLSTFMGNTAALVDLKNRIVEILKNRAVLEMYHGSTKS